MRPLRISMKGFGAFRERTDIDLADVDLVALVGPTGSGKSTIIDAITFALYGTVTRYEDNRLVAPVINQTSNEARVALDFELDGQVMTAVRIVRRTTGGGATTREARLERGANVLADDATSMSQEVERILGLDVEQFNRTVVLPQGKFATFLHAKPGDRQKTLVRLLGMELYGRIGRAARQRAARARNHVEALQPDFERKTGELTDQGRDVLTSRIRELDAAHSRFKADREAINTLDAELRDLDAEIGRLDHQRHRMEGIAAPAGLAELADQIAEAVRTRIQTEERRRDLGTKRRAAREALENGPDVATVQLGLKTHSELAQRTREHEAVVEQRDRATRTHQSAKAAADRIRAKQAEVDRRLEQARETEDRARAALAAGVTVAQVEAWTAAHARHQAASKATARATQAARSAEAALRPAKAALADAETAAAASSERLAALRRHAGVAGHVDLLEVGSACPLCLQEVHELPTHDLDIHVRQAQADDEAAQAARVEARQAFENADRELIKRRADASSALKNLAECESEIESVPQSDQLDTLRAESAELAEAVRSAGEATREADAAASQHRESAGYADTLDGEQVAERRVTRLGVSEDLLRSQLMSLRANVAELPDERELGAQLAEADRLKVELDEADSGFNDADAAYERATAELDKVNRRRDQAIKLLHDSRDRVAAFGPPTIDTSDPAAAWGVLTGWIRDHVRAAAAERKAATELTSSKANHRSAVVHSLRERCSAVLGGVDPGASMEELGELLTKGRAASATELDHFDRRRDELEELRQRIDVQKDRATVATHLGRLLRSDGFERWLMEAALDQLVDRATGRLFELSDGQYSLTVHKNDFAVRDHTNADEVRSARTLSGGETFLASLSLALAVADATAELAAEGAPRMESIFLDEGFGTLDPHTLDTVATAVEELGTTGRFVGIVTHIRELADRMPVRLEVTKTGGSATVERIET
ncbi:MAG: SMC family ATPase [bacterium]|nr:SMC family ATPase [bacterium]